MAQRSTEPVTGDRPKEKGVWSYVLAGLSGGLLLIVVGLAAAVIVVP